MTGKTAEGGVTLDDNERLTVALLLIAEAAIDELHGPQWEDTPELAESEWELVVAEIANQARLLVQRAHKIGQDIGQEAEVCDEPPLRDGRFDPGRLLQELRGLCPTATVRLRGT